MNKPYLALNNLQWLICHQNQTKPNQTKPNHQTPVTLCSLLD